MWPRIAIRNTIILLVALVLSVLVFSSISAQEANDPTETPTEESSPTPLPTAAPTDIPTQLPTAIPILAPQITVTGSQPDSLMQGVGGLLTISGTNFTGDTTVSLNNSIALPITARSDHSLTASVGADVTAGVYIVEVSDPNGGLAAAIGDLTITEPTAVPQLVVTETEPRSITAGQGATLSIIGSNFSTNTTVRLVGYGFLSTTFVNNSALTAGLPANLPVGSYSIEVSDQTYGTATASTGLTVNAVPATTAPVATATPTSTPIPGQPELIVGSFNASPSSIYPGGTTQLTLQIANVGSRTAEGVVVSLGDSKFAPANGQSSVTLPDLASGTSYTTTLSVTAPMDASEGTQSISIVITSRDFSGQTYSDNAAASVAIMAKPVSESQVVLDSYRVTPNSAAPGDSVNVQALFKNTGTETASQVLIQLDSANSVLIAGSEGNAFSIGDIPAGSSAPIVMPLVVASDIKSGVLAQSFTISYLQDGDAKQATASISLDVKATVTQSPLVLLQSYSSGQDNPLQPGQQFSFNMTLQNAGAVDVSNLLVTFGTVASTTSSNATAASPTTTSTTASSSFVIYGSGGTLLLGDLSAGKSGSLSQSFIVSNDVSSGIQDLPITLQYQESDGTVTQQSMDASLFVVVPASIRITSTKTLDDPLTAGTTATLSLKISNSGSADAALTEMLVTGDNATISSAAYTALDPMAAGDDTTKTVTFVPQAAGAYTVTVKVDYVDDLNQKQTITQTFSGQVTAATVQQTRPARPDLQSAQQTTQNDTELGRLLLGFLGFGG